MDVGTGIFLSSLFFGLIGLYWFTRDRWRWKRIVGIGFAGLCGLTALFYVALLGYEWWSNRPVVHTSLTNINLGAMESDVVFANGKPTKAERDHNSSIETRLTYDDGESFRLILIQEGRVVSILRNIPERYYGSLPDQGPYLARGTKQDRIEGLYGLPTSVDQPQGGEVRILRYPNYQVDFALTREGVNWVRVYDANKLKGGTTTR
jgi:hypothetical protein